MYNLAKDLHPSALVIAALCKPRSADFLVDCRGKCINLRNGVDDHEFQLKDGYCEVTVSMDGHQTTYLFFITAPGQVCRNELTKPEMLGSILTGRCQLENNSDVF